MQKSKTQNGILGFFEKHIRKYVLIYCLIRSIAIKFDIFEEDFKILKKIYNSKKINIIDVGASDGIAANFFLKNLNVGNIYCYEPHSLFINKLKKLKRKNPKIKIFKHGISSINEDIYVFVPLIEFFSKKIYLLTYTFYDFKELTMQLKLDFLNYKKIIIEKVKLRLKKFRLIQNKIDLIKIDVNGYEFEIIQSLNKQIAKDKPLLIIENNSKLQKISKYLKKYGYKRYFNKKNNLTIHTNENVLDVFYIYQK
jgi:FkbM family methyltransferase